MITKEDGDLFLDLERTRDGWGNGGRYGGLEGGGCGDGYGNGDGDGSCDATLVDVKCLFLIATSVDLREIIAHSRVSKGES